MSRFCGNRDSTGTLRAAAHWRDVALLSDGSVFSAKLTWHARGTHDLAILSLDGFSRPAVASPIGFDTDATEVPYEVIGLDGLHTRATWKNDATLLGIGPRTVRALLVQNRLAVGIVGASVTEFDKKNGTLRMARFSLLPLSLRPGSHPERP